MAKMTMSGYFKSLNAPLVNRVRSWGAINHTSGDVVFRIWADEKIRGESGLKGRYRLTDFALFADKLMDVGFQERLQHIEIARSKARAFFVLCRAKDETVQPRTIKSFKSDLIGFTNAIVRHNNDWWLEETNYLTRAVYFALIEESSLNQS